MKHKKNIGRKINWLIFLLEILWSEWVKFTSALWFNKPYLIIAGQLLDGDEENWKIKSRW